MVKKSSRQVIERYYSKMTLDYHTNKKILQEVAIRVDRIEVGQETLDLLESLGMMNLPGVVLCEDEGPISVAPPMNYGCGGSGRRY